MTNLANELSRRGHSIVYTVAFANSNDYALESDIRKLNLDIGHKPNTLSKLVSVMKRIVSFRSILKSEVPDVVITFLPYSVIVATIAARFLRIPLIVSIRSDPYKTFKNPVLALGAKILYSRANGCVFQTQHAMSFFSRRMQKKSIIIGNVVESRFFRTPNAANQTGIIGVGRLHKCKRWDVAIRAFSLIAEECADNFTIYGVGEELAKLKELVDELHLADRIIFGGYTQNIEVKYSTSRLFVMSSEYEGIPNALLEALAMGLPCVTTLFSGGACEEIMEDGVNGFVISNIGDVKALAEAMKKILEDDKLADFLSCNAKKRAESFQPDSVVSEWENYIMETIKCAQ
jgi:glycosyltransferase involved in cell wall biosynthesis